MFTHREDWQGDLIPKFVLLWVIFSFCPVGGTNEAIHKERYHHFCHLVHQLGDDQQRCQALHIDRNVSFGPPDNFFLNSIFQFAFFQEGFSFVVRMWLVSVVMR